MFKIPLEQVKEKIKKGANLTDGELANRIKQKMEKLSNLISEEGACHIIANELKVQLYDGTENKVQIKEIKAGMRGVEVTGKVMRKFEVKEFSTGERQGKVASFVMGDETGMVRVTLWNDQADNLNKLNEGDVVQIKSAYVRENRGVNELHMNTNSELEINPAGVTVGEIKEVQSQVEKVRKQIKDLAENDSNVEILGTIVQVFDLRFFTVCPDCNKRVYEREGKFSCGVHGDVVPSQNYVMNVFLDDGSENIRTVFWKEQILRLLGKTDAEVLKYKDEPTAFEEVKNDLLGNIVKLVGRVNKNEMFDRLEFSAQLVFPEPDAQEEIDKLN
ncbi:MAG: hypothetical protein KAT77_02095 [Nanoarchaeota archaeon]|nr:hypothetical protein [Nanoarchaeota archaeon]